MLLTMANGGEEGTSHFTNAITASPYLPEQWEFDGLEPTQVFERFAEVVGCSPDRNSSCAAQTQSVLHCLRQSDSVALRNASFYMSGTVKYGQWAFLSVTDHDFIRERPSAQLATGRVNGLHMLTGVSSTLYWFARQWNRTGFELTTDNTCLSSFAEQYR